MKAHVPNFAVKSLIVDFHFILSMLSLFSARSALRLAGGLLTRPTAAPVLSRSALSLRTLFTTPQLQLPATKAKPKTATTTKAKPKAKPTTAKPKATAKKPVKKVVKKVAVKEKPARKCTFSLLPDSFI